MKAVVLAGGEGKRLEPLTQSRPKPLIPIAGRPCIDFVLKSLIQSGFREIVITTSYMSQHVIRRIGDGLRYNASVLYSFEASPAGTAGAVKRVANFIDSTFVVVMGDVLVDCDLRPLLDFHRRKGGAATIALTEVADPTEYGIVGLDSGSRIVKFREKPSQEEAFSNLVNAGIYILEPEILDLIPDHRMFDFAKDVFPKLLAKGLALYGRRIEGLWLDIGRPRDLIQASLEIVRREGRPRRLKGVETSGPLIVGDAAVDAGAVLRGPCFVADGARIEADTLLDHACVYEGSLVARGAVIRRSVVLENGRVGVGSEIVESVLARDSVVEEDVRVVHSIIGDGMTVKAHSRLENASVSPPSGRE
jgi:mannose-1-phosphate guanylyltransferase